MVTVYVLISLSSGLHYVGITNELQRRLTEHNAGKSKFTSGHIPWKLIYQEEYPDYPQARKREKYLKSAAGKKFLQKKLQTPEIEPTPPFHGGNTGSLPD